MAYEQQAKAAGDARFAGEQQNILTQQQLAAIRAQAEQAALNQWGTTGREAIDQSFQGLLSDMTANRGRAMDVINQQTQNVGSGYDLAAQGAQAVRDESRNYLSQLMGNYGLGETVPGIQSGMEDLTNKLVERNLRYGQDARTSLGNWGAQHDVMYGDAQTNARGAQAFQQSAFQSQLGNLLSAAQAAQREREIEFASALQGLAAQRGGFEVEYAQGLADRDTERNLKMAEMQMRANLEQAQLDAAANRFNAERSYQGQDDSWDREKFYASLGLDKRKQDFAEWVAQQEMMGQGTDYSGISGMRTHAQDRGDPGIFDAASKAIQRAASQLPPGTDPTAIGQRAASQFGVPQGIEFFPEYRRQKSTPSQRYQDIIDNIAIGTGRY